MNHHTRSMRTASLTSGLALALLAVLAAFGVFGAVGALITPGNAAKNGALVSAPGPVGVVDGGERL